MTIREIIDERGIRELLHFTTNRGIVGTLSARALLSRYRLPQDKHLQHVLHVNAAVRPEAAASFDKSQNWLDYVNLSISEINRRYLDVSRRWHNDRDVWWGILSFDPDLMTHEGVVFATTNNSYDQCIRCAGAEGLEKLFSNHIRRKSTWSVSRWGRSDCLPTCEQAEVLYPGAVDTAFLRRIYVEDEEHHDQASGWLREFGYDGVEVAISAQKFIGKQN